MCTRAAKVLFEIRMYDDTHRSGLCFIVRTYLKTKMRSKFFVPRCRYFLDESGYRIFLRSTFWQTKTRMHFNSYRYRAIQRSQIPRIILTILICPFTRLSLINSYRLDTVDTPPPKYATVYTVHLNELVGSSEYEGGVMGLYPLKK